MTLPDWWAATLLTLAAYRLFRLIGEDKFTERPRHWLLNRLEGRRAGRGEYWSEFITCPWCAGFWIVGVLLLGYAAVDELDLPGFLLAWFGISAGVGFLAGVQALVDRFNG